ncbi:hypothetical protein BN8_02118 [Fibrisoma limi BUZ 3]|uniref:Uncharacterized protein n=1 Tax=Fibrisoma limi BUZ 3 TaxID=1185876 RepID=I2GGN0_9BACT|nr:hypothetical protein BN8_02118 [Fibrisoma limi BUZ 3]
MIKPNLPAGINQAYYKNRKSARRSIGVSGRSNTYWGWCQVRNLTPTPAL